MIEKLKNPSAIAGASDPVSIAYDVLRILVPKINEIIDAVNKLEQSKRRITKCRNCGHHEEFHEACVCNHELGKLSNHLDICMNYGNQREYCQFYEE